MGSLVAMSIEVTEGMASTIIVRAMVFVVHIHRIQWLATIRVRVWKNLWRLSVVMVSIILVVRLLLWRVGIVMVPTRRLLLLCLLFIRASLEVQILSLLLLLLGL